MVLLERLVARKALLLAFLAGVLVALPLALVASSVSVPHTFQDGTVASAAQVNANFDAVKVAVNDNALRIASLEATATVLDCQTTGWGTLTACATNPEATPPACPAGYTFTGIANLTQSDAGCGASSITRAMVKSRCCRAVP